MRHPVVYILGLLWLVAIFAVLREANLSIYARIVRKEGGRSP